MTLTTGGSFNDKGNFIWSVADLLRGDFKQSEYGRVVLPLVVLRRLDGRDVYRELTSSNEHREDGP